MSLLRDDRHEGPKPKMDEPEPSDIPRALDTVNVRETNCKSALSRSKLTGLFYALNPYRGCEHACLYCYSPAVLHYEGNEPWGEFVEARTNMPVHLAREMKKLTPGIVGIGTVTDPYQPPERWFRVTRHCLEQLLHRQWPIVVHTKSRLVADDSHLLKEFKDVEVVFTFTTADDGERAAFEPRSSTVSERLGAIKALKDSAVPVSVYFGPVLPGAVEKGLEELFSELVKLSVKRISVDRLRMHRGVWERMRHALEARHPELLQEYRSILYGKSDSYEQLLLDIVEKAQNAGMSAKLVKEP